MVSQMTAQYMAGSRRMAVPVLCVCLAACIATSGFAEPFAPIATSASIVPPAPSFASTAQQMLGQQYVADQLAADRQFVAAALKQQQLQLEEIMAANQAMMNQPPSEMPTESLFASRIADFAAVQTEIVTDYSDLLRLRTSGVSESVDDRGEALSLLFAQTGFIFGAPDVVVVTPTPLPAPTLPSPTVPFPGFPVAIGGFFAAEGQ